jgi:nucleotide-binding universal stress UspA family protein
MGKQYSNELRERMLKALQRAKDKLIEGGFQVDKIQIEMVTEPYPTIAEGIIDQCQKRNIDIVVIGRKRMSKAEEFVLGDVSVKLIRALEGVAVLVIKSH